MGWGLDFDFSEIIDTVFDASSDFITDVVADVEFSDIVAAAGVGSSIYFQQQQLKQQEAALESQLQASLVSQTTQDQAAAQAADDAVTVDVGEADITTEKEAALEVEEQALNVGRIKADKRKKKSTADNKLKAVKSTQLGGSISPFKI